MCRKHTEHSNNHNHHHHNNNHSSSVVKFFYNNVNMKSHVTSNIVNRNK